MTRHVIGAPYDQNAICSIEVTTDTTLDNYTAVTDVQAAGLTVTLPPSPKATQTHRVIASALGAVTIDGNGNAISDVSVPASTTRDYTFSSLSGWIASSGPSSGVVTRQISEVELEEDTTSTSNPYVTLLETTITTGVGFLALLATITGISVDSYTSLRLTVDGVAVANGGSLMLESVDGFSPPASILKRVPITAGEHTIALEWSLGPGGSAVSVNPTAGAAQHASLRSSRPTSDPDSSRTNALSARHVRRRIHA